MKYRPFLVCCGVLKLIAAAVFESFVEGWGHLADGDQDDQPGEEEKHSFKRNRQIAFERPDDFRAPDVHIIDDNDEKCRRNKAQGSRYESDIQGPSAFDDLDQLDQNIDGKDDELE